MRITCHLLGALLLACMAFGETVTFEEHVQPILKANCFHCHGEEERLKGGLDLRLVGLIHRGGESGSVIEAGRAEDSRLFQLVASGEMPPKEEHRLSAKEVSTIARWIEGGAENSLPEPEILPEPGEYLITARERSHWAFRPVVKPELPGPGHPVDAFVGARLKERGLNFSQEADPVVLLRRLSMNLTGLPPSVEDVEAFRRDPSPAAWDRAIDRMLDSPHYGERWGRHWLDVAGYADSEGYNDKDVVREDAWMYRDYVIRSFNEDKPWDEFIVEQLAGDELAEVTAESAVQLARKDPEVLRKLTATGFLRMAPDGSGSGPDDPVAARNAVLTETIKVISSSLLGLTVGCAECHDHRFDPIPQEDFYRLRAVLAPVFDTEDWRLPKNRQLSWRSPEEEARYAELYREMKPWMEAHDRRKEEVVRLVFERELKEIPEQWHELGRAAFDNVPDKRTEEQLALFKKYPALRVDAPRLHLFVAKYEDGDALRESYEKHKKKADAIRSSMPPLTKIRVATEKQKARPVTRVFHRGDPNSPEGEAIDPGGLTLFAEVGESMADGTADQKRVSSGRRLAWARHLTQGEHPLVARVLVNRVWMHHFGRGLVDTPGDWGLRTGPPSHPQLLDWLAADFVEHGWQLKRLHKLILTSNTWRQVTQRRPEAERIDAQNRLLWRMPVRRLEAEVVRDSILAVSGALNRHMHGPSVPVAESENGIFSVGGGSLSADRKEWKRSLYVQVRRTQPVDMLQAFDAPAMEPNCARRVSSTVATQSLAMLNGTFVQQQSEEFARRVVASCGPDPVERVQMAWREAFGVAPTSQERDELLRFLTAQSEEMKDDQRALASLCQVLLSSNRFLYVD